MEGRTAEFWLNAHSLNLYAHTWIPQMFVNSRQKQNYLKFLMCSPLTSPAEEQFYRIIRMYCIIWKSFCSHCDYPPRAPFSPPPSHIDWLKNLQPFKGCFFFTEQKWYFKMMCRRSDGWRRNSVHDSLFNCGEGNFFHCFQELFPYYFCGVKGKGPGKRNTPKTCSLICWVPGTGIEYLEFPVCSSLKWGDEVRWAC